MTELSGVMNAITKEGTGAVEMAAYMVGGAVAYTFLQPYINGATSFVPSNMAFLKPAIGGAVMVAAGYYFKQKVVIGLGAGLIAVAAYEALAPVAQSIALKTVGVVAKQ